MSRQPGSTQRRPRAAVLVATVLVSALLGVSVGCGQVATPSSQNILNLNEVLKGMVEEVLRLESAAFSLEHLEGTTALVPGFLEMTKAYGVVDIPDRFRFKIEAESLRPRSYVEISVITIGEQAYMTDPKSGNWLEVDPAVLPFNLSNLGQTLASIISAVEEPALLEAQHLRGYDTHHIRGRILSQDLKTLVPAAGQRFDVALDLWVEQSTNLLVQVLISGMVVPTDEPDTVRRLTLDDINVPVAISAPK